MDFLSGAVVTTRFGHLAPTAPRRSVGFVHEVDPEVTAEVPQVRRAAPVAVEDGDVWVGGWSGFSRDASSAGLRPYAAERRRIDPRDEAVL